MAGIVSRLVAPLDRIPAPQAFAFTALVGAVEGFILFAEEGLPEIPFLSYSLPIVAFIGLTLLATALVGFSRPVVARREVGSVGERVRGLLLNFGRLAMFHALAAAIFFVPVVVYKVNKWSQAPASVGRSDVNTIATTVASSSAADSATPNPSTAPSAAAMTSPAPTSSATPSSSPVAPTIATTSSKAAVRAPAKTIADKPEQPRTPTLGDDADP